MIVQLVPVSRGGVSDYAEELSGVWRRSGKAEALLALDEAGATASSLAARLDALGARTLIVHMSCYGYGPRGLFAWLVRQIEAARRGRDLRLVTIFHETYAFGPPWRSAFWTALPQRRSLIDLANLSDGLWTNTERHARWLRRHTAKSTPINASAVFSNIGEPEAAPPLADRQAQMVIFGSANSRTRAVEATPDLATLCRRLNLRRVVEVGGGPSVRPAGYGKPWDHLGMLPREEVSALLLSSSHGLVHHPADELAKSGVFAAYASHGCVSVTAARSRAASDGLTPGTQFFDRRRLMAGLGAQPAQAAADAARAWYSNHRLPRQAEMILEMEFAGRTA